MNDEFDVIRAALTGDKQAVLQDQLTRIDQEVLQRLAINITTRETLHTVLREVREEILRLEPAHDGAPDDARREHERLILKRDYWQFLLRLGDEQRSCWQDTQHLKTDARHAEKELLTVRQRDRRLQEFL
jgi:hypothetical protein